jgi:hypothetical protein
MEREGFLDIVKESWSMNTFHRHAIDKWQEKMRRLRRALKGIIREAKDRVVEKNSV